MGSQMNVHDAGTNVFLFIATRGLHQIKSCHASTNQLPSQNISVHDLLGLLFGSWQGKGAFFICMGSVLSW